MTVSQQRRRQLRMARKLQAAYQRQRALPGLDTILDIPRWHRLARQVRRLTFAVESGRERMAAYVQPRLQSALQQLNSELTAAIADLARFDCTQKVPSLRLLSEELAALEEEFEAVELDLGQRQITGQTESLVLDDVPLGSFEIRLSLDQLGSHPPYAAVALDPHPPASNDEITHPHVQNGTLCEGEGRHAIRQALAQGRIGDFFLLVAQVLRTYNASSAYCRLQDWVGAPCADCGDLIGDEDESSCEHCDCRLCDGCTRYCRECEATICGECSARCDECGSRPCGRCVQSCSECGRSLCAECRGNEVCPRCHELSQETIHDPSEDASLAPSPAAAGAPQTAPPAADAAVQPLCLGEAGVSA